MTGVEIPVSGGYRIPPGTVGDDDHRRLLAESIALLYAVVGSAQAAEILEDEKEHAVQQMVLVNAAAAAAEADAFLTLLACGLEHQAHIHLRGIGQMARRMILCRKQPDFALKLYRSAQASSNKLMNRVLPAVGLMGGLEVTGPDMRKIEDEKSVRDAYSEIEEPCGTLTSVESELFSKTSHGDISVLVMIANRLNVRGGDVRFAIGTEGDPLSPNIRIYQAIGFCLQALLELLSEFDLPQAKADAERIMSRYLAMMQHEQTTGPN